MLFLLLQSSDASASCSSCSMANIMAKAVICKEFLKANWSTLAAIFPFATVTSNLLAFTYNQALAKALASYHEIPDYNFTGCKIRVEVDTNLLLLHLHDQGLTSYPHNGLEPVRNISSDMPERNTDARVTGRFVDVVTRSTQCRCPLCTGYEHDKTHDFTGCAIDGVIGTSELQAAWLKLVYSNPDHILTSTIIIPSFFQSFEALVDGQVNCGCTCPLIETEESKRIVATAQTWTQTGVSGALTVPFFAVYYNVRKKIKSASYEAN